MPPKRPKFEKPIRVELWRSHRDPDDEIPRDDAREGKEDTPLSRLINVAGGLGDLKVFYNELISRVINVSTGEEVVAELNSAIRKYELGGKGKEPGLVTDLRDRGEKIINALELNKKVKVDATQLWRELYINKGSTWRED